VAPPYEPPGASPEMLLHHRLAVLRHHRADAHAAAWQAAGHTVDTIRGLADGPQRERIEAETNRRASLPYATLSAVERSRLLSGLTGPPASRSQRSNVTGTAGEDCLGRQDSVHLSGLDQRS